MPNKPRDDLWERQKNESQQAYEAFVVYRDLGAERSITRVVQELNKSRALIGKWSSRFKWVERCRAYDNHLDEIARREAEKRYKEMTSRHIEIATTLQTRALKSLKALPEDAISPKYIIQFLDKALAIEKAARSEEAGIVRGGKSAGGQQQDEGGGSLADEIIAAYEARTRGGDDE